MKRAIIVVSVATSLIIRLILASQTGLSYDGYETLLQVQHIAEYAVPLYSNTASWGGSHYVFMPLFHYIIALTTIILPLSVALFLIPNVMFSLLPIPVYLLAREITKTRGAAEVVTIASAFTPLLYQTSNQASPISLAIPLMFWAYYLFIRLGKTPKDQNLFIIAIFTLLFTHPIALLLVPAMALTLLLTHIQRTTFRKAQAEATIFTTFFFVWGYAIVYKNTLANYGIATFLIIREAPTLSTASLATLVGIIPLFAGTYAAFNYLVKERNEAAHAMTALGMMTLVLMITRIIPFLPGMIIFSTVLIILSAGSIELYVKARERSRLPSLYRAAYMLLLLLFVATNVVPAITYGIASLNDAPGREEQRVIEDMRWKVPKGSMVYWDQEKGHYLQAKGYSVPFDDNMLANPQSITIKREMDVLEQTSSQIQYIELLNKYDVDYVVLPGISDRPITDRCFKMIIYGKTEVYKLECAVE